MARIFVGYTAAGNAIGYGAKTCKLTQELVRAAGRLRAQGFTYPEIARRLEKEPGDLCPTTLRYAVLGPAWRRAIVRGAWREARTKANNQLPEV